MPLLAKIMLKNVTGFRIKIKKKKRGRKPVPTVGCGGKLKLSLDFASFSFQITKVLYQLQDVVIDKDLMCFP